MKKKDVAIRAVIVLLALASLSLFALFVEEKRKSEVFLGGLSGTRRLLFSEGKRLEPNLG